MEGSAGVLDDAASRLRALWLRRDVDALDHLFAHCSLPSVTLPTIRGSKAEIHVGAGEALEAMRSELGEPQIAEGVLAAGLYFHALLGWEESDDFDKINQFVDAAVGFLDSVGAGARFHSVSAARHMLESIKLQCRTEEARLCACSYSMQLIAGEVVEFLAKFEIPPRGKHHVDELMLDLVRRDAANAFTFHALLAEVVAPLAGRFDDVLLETSDAEPNEGLSPARAQLQGDIRTALPELRRVADELSASGEVLGGELAVQADALARMDELLEAPSIVLDRGQLIYVYPFTLDQPDQGAGFGEHGDYRLHLADGANGSIPVRFEEIERSDAWNLAAEGASGAFSFEDRGELVLGDGYELRFRPKWIEMEEDREAIAPETDFHACTLRVVLGAHGGHYLHLQTQIAERAGEDGPDPWSGPHIDQWVRRLGKDAGADRVSLHHHGELVLEWEKLHDFATAVATAVDRAEHPRDEETEVPEPDLVGATVLFVTEAARVIEPDGTDHPLTVDDGLERLTGYTALMASTRYLPASVEEWVRLDAPAPENLLAGLRPLGDVLLVNGEVMALLPLGSPNWVVMEQVEILEFAISLHGYLEHLSDQLLHLLRSEERSGAPPTSKEVSDGIRVGNGVLELLRSRSLMRSRYHSELLNRISSSTGASDLDTRVAETIEALRDLRRGLEEEESNRHAHNLDRAVFWLTAVTVFIAAHQFGVSLLSEGEADTEVGVLLIALATTALLATAYRRLRRRFE